MKGASLISLGALATRVLAQDAFESLDFNVTEALIANGFNVSAVPELYSLSGQSLSSPCAIACRSLKLVSGAEVLTPGPQYDNFTAGYWSESAAAVSPTCVFKPSKALDVSTLVLLSRLTQCPFAVKSGGHTAFPGASSIEGGITVSLEQLNEITVSTDKKVASIGSGNRWGHVYRTLEPQNLAVAGGRASSVGVGGLLLGGGISHHSNIYGLGCDNVASYELVTASGTILHVSSTRFPDLYWALRGGGNNFGIVTKFDLQTISQGPIWGGFRVFITPEYPRVIEAFANLAESATEDPKAVQILSFAVTNGTAVAQVELEYTEPVDKANPPAVLQEWLSLGAISDSTANRTLASAADNLDAQMPGGRRAAFWAATFKLDRELMTWMTAYFHDNVGYLADQTALSFQAFTVPALQQMSKNGGNALGLDAQDGPLFHVLLFQAWEDGAKDGVLREAAQDFIDAAKAEAERRGSDHRFIYLNYAGPYQTVIPSYGSPNVQRLKGIAGKYDPKGVFRTLQPGGFKLDGAPYDVIL